MKEWGSILKQWYRKESSYREADFTINYLGYWTDNGNYLWYKFCLTLCLIEYNVSCNIQEPIIITRRSIIKPMNKLLLTPKPMLINLVYPIGKHE